MSIKTRAIQLLTLLSFVLLVATQTVVPSNAPSFKPSAKPTARPTSKAPTAAPVHIYGKSDPVFLSSDAQQGIVGALTIVLFILMATEILAPEILFLIALMIITGCQIINITDALSGFSNESLITIGTLFLVVGAVERSHAVDYLARKAFGADGSDMWGKWRMYSISFLLSIFFNNTPLVAILLPVVKDWGRMRNIAASQLLMPLSFSVLSGSFISMIGTSTNLTVQALMQADKGYSFNFFAPAPIGAPLFVLVTVYMLIAGPYLLPTDKSGLIRAVKEKAEKLLAEVYVSQDSLFVGKPLNQMMNSLGLAPSLALKIRRRVVSEKVQDGLNFPPPRTISTRIRELITNLQDPAYLQRISGLWTPAQLRKSAPSKDNLAAGEYELTTAYPTKDVKDATGANPTVTGGKEYVDIIAPTYHEIITAGDIVFIAYAQDVVEKMMKSIAGESKGLYVLQSNALDLPGYGTEIVECIISDTNPFVGKTVGSLAQKFSERYQVGLITVRGKDWGSKPSTTTNTTAIDEATAPPTTNTQDPETTAKEIIQETTQPPQDPEAAATAVVIAVDEEASVGMAAASHTVPADDTNSSNNSNTKDESTDERAVKLAAEELKVISDHVLQYGDIVLCVTDETNLDSLHRSRDFFVVSSVGELPIPMTIFSFFPVLVFFTMLILAATETLDICPGSMMAASFFFIGGWITAEDIPKMIDLRLLMLIGTSLSFAKGMTKSGLATTIAQSINDSNPSDFGALLLIYAITLVITELISNNAAAALMYPIASALATELGSDFKPFAMAVLVAATAGFMSPIGYQTHVMVWGPGGYSFWNFVVFGFVPDILYWIIGCFLIVAVFPF